MELISLITVVIFRREACRAAVKIAEDEMFSFLVLPFIVLPFIV